MSSLQSDIEYMKSLAEDGSRAPLRHGAFLFWAGLLFGAASVAQYLVAVNLLPQNGNLSAAIWLVASLVYLIIAVVVGMRTRGAGSAGNRAAAAVWSSVGIGIVILLVSLTFVARQINEVQAAVYMISPVIMVLYGMGWWVSAAMSGRNWLRTISIGSFLGAPVMAVMAGRPEQLLAYAVALVLFAIIPGFILMRGARA